jgi:hypothetical protein
VNFNDQLITLGLMGAGSALLLLRMRSFVGRRFGTIPFRSLTVLLGVSLILLGLGLRPIVEMGFVSGFCVVSGFQISLWSLGLIFEILGNAPTE